MMKWCFGLLWLLGSVQAHLRRSLSDSVILCDVYHVDVTYEHEEPSDRSFVCVTDLADGSARQMIELEWSAAMREKLQVETRAIPFSIEISSALVDLEQATLTVPDDSHVQVVHHHRRLTQTMGTSRVLVLRVTYLGIQPTYSASELAGRIFGKGPHRKSPNVAEQYARCSAGKLRLVPAEGDGVVDGVAEIVVKSAVSGSNEVRALDNKVIQLASQRFGNVEGQYDHIVVILPDADLSYSGRTFLAYAWLDGPRSTYNDWWGGEITALMHEIGHNLYLHHSGEGSLEYGDETGYMGFGRQAWLRMCFNAQKHWTLGWFQDRSVSIGLEDLPWSGNLVFFGDYDQTYPGSYVVIEVRGSRRLFLQYNLDEDLNGDTREYGGEVVVVSDSGSDASNFGHVSWLEGHFMVDHPNTRDKYREDNFAGTGHQLVIRACQKIHGDVRYVQLSMHLTNGEQTNTCSHSLGPAGGPSYCDDSKEASFFVDGSRGYKDCSWLGSTIDHFFEDLCIPEHDAYHLCPELCGKCRDQCEDDSKATFYVNTRHGFKDCAWLSTRYQQQEKLCVEGHDAYEYCKESCDRCDQ